VKGWLEGTFPELRGNVTGGNYPPPPIVELISNFLSIFQLLGIIFAVTGDSIFRMFGFQRTPAWYEDIVMKNGVPIMIFLYLVLPQILSSYVVSGAFEVMLDGNDLIFSKIATGRMPQANDLIATLTKAGVTYVSQS
jgi:selT/selW/selH-like putative selenoprotein